MKGITRHALFVSMILHVLLLIGLFYYSISNQSILPFQDKIDGSIETLRKTPSKKPIQTPVRRQFKTNVHEAAKAPLAKVESITPEMTFQSQVETPVVSEQPRLKHTNTAPDVKVNVSTTISELREVENGLSKTEAAGSTGGGSLGSKRSGVQGIQRAPIRPTLDVAGTTDSNNDLPTKIPNIQTNKASLSNTPYSNVMKSFANEIIKPVNSKQVDVVFVIDTSRSMSGEIKVVAKHVTEMIDIFITSGIDYALGLTQFSAFDGRNFIKVFQLTQSLVKYQQEIDEIMVRENEHALDAVKKTVKEMRFRPTSKKHLILITDEPFTSMEGVTVEDVIKLCRESGIHVNVLGLSDKKHRLLASATGGKWHPIPGK